jgi:tetratricopeptide (TPR) repeat protein
MSARAGAAESKNAQPIARADVLAQVERIAGHSLFRQSHQLTAFLRFAVDAALDGEVGRLKELVIGSMVFRRGGAFDPQTDNVVRVSANRLRGKLAEYYRGDGRADALVIDLPRGGYVPHFSWSRPDAPRSATTVQFPAVSRTSVGRQHELDRLHAAFESASAAPGLMVSIAGDAGMGKTTLVEDFLTSLSTPEAPVWIARGRCSERLGKTEAFVPILDCLEDLTRGAMGAEATQVMARTAPTWLSQIAPEREPGPATMRPGASPDRMRREFARFFEDLSAIHPVVLFLDDVHWIDTSTCDLIAFVGDRMKQMRLLIVVTARPAELLGGHPFPPMQIALERRDACRRMGLDLLTLADVESYVARQFPSNGFPPELAAVVQERTEGNPLFMRDLVAFLIDRRIVAEQGGVWRLERDVADLRTMIPANTQSMIRLKTEQFDEADRRILQCGAVQGIVFDSAVVSRVLAIDAADVEERLQSLDRAHRFVRADAERECADHTYSVRYRFSHVFYQNALQADLAPSRRAALSLAVAESLIGLAGGPDRAPASEVALLFEVGRDHDRASQYLLRAARHAARVFAYPEAALLAERGVSSLRALPESAERDARELELQLTLGMAQMATKGYASPDAELTHRRSRELCVRLNETRRLVRVLWGLHTCLLNAGELMPAYELAREMRELADRLDDPRSITESLHALGTTLAFMGDVTGARDALERIFELSPIGEHRYCGSLFVLDPCVTSLSMLARVLARMGQLDDALGRAVASLDLANGLPHPPSIAYAVFWLGWTHHARGEHDAARDQLETAMALGRAHALPQIVEWARVVRGSSLVHLGHVADGIAEIRTSLDNQAAMRCLLERPYCLMLLAEALILANEPRAALALCDEALDLARDTGARSYETDTERLREGIAGTMIAFEQTELQS